MSTFVVTVGLIYLLFLAMRLSLLFRIGLGASLFVVYPFRVPRDKILGTTSHWFRNIVFRSIAIPSDNVSPASTVAFMDSYVFHSVFCLRDRFSGFLFRSRSLFWRVFSLFVFHKSLCQEGLDIGAWLLPSDPEVVAMRYSNTVLGSPSSSIKTVCDFI